MPFSNEIDADLGLICFIAIGYITVKQLVDFDQTIFIDPARRPNMKIIADLRRASIDVDMDSIKGLLSRNRELNQKGWEMEKTAVVTHDQMLASVVDAYELMGSNLHLKLKVCETLDEALQWLELDGKKEQVYALHRRLLTGLEQNP